MEFITIAKDFGIPIALLVFLCFAIWKVLVWLGNEVVKPLTERHIKFIDKVEKSIIDQAKNVETVTSQSSVVIELNKENAEAFKDLLQHITELKNNVNEVKTVMINTGAVQILPKTPGK